MQRKGVRKLSPIQNMAVTPVFTVLLIVIIVSSVIATTLAIGLFTTDEFNDQKDSENMEMQFNNLLNKIEELSRGNSRDKKSIRFAIGEGTIGINSNIIDRTVITYSYDYGYDFAVIGLNDDDYKFELNIIQGDVEWAEAKWDTNDDGVFDDHHETLMQDGPIFESPSPEDYPFVGSVLIELYHGGYSGSEPFGKIWLFDSNSLIFSDSDGDYNFVLEKAGILYDNFNDVQIKRAPIINVDDRYLAVRVFQIQARHSISVGTNEYNVNFDLDITGNVKQEAKNVFHLRLQFHNGYSTHWFMHYKDLTNFFEAPPENLLFEPSTSSDGFWFTLLHSIVKVDIY